MSTDDTPTAPATDERQPAPSLPEDMLIVRGERRLPRRLASAAIQRLEIPHGHFERRLALPAGTWQLAGQELANGCLQLLLVRRSSGPR